MIIKRSAKIYLLVFSLFFSLMTPLKGFANENISSMLLLLLKGKTLLKTQTIDSNGGTVQVDQPSSSMNRVKIEIPEGAVKGDETFSIYLLPELDNTLPSIKNPLVAIQLNTTANYFWRSVLVSIPYPDEDNDGIVDGTSFPENQLYVYSTDEYRVDWERLPVVSLDTVNNVIVVRCFHFSDLVISPHPSAVDYSEYECGVPDHRFFFSGKINPTCDDRIDFHLFWKLVWPALQSSLVHLTRSLGAVVDQNEMIDEAIWTVGQVYSAFKGYNGVSPGVSYTNEEIAALLKTGTSWGTHYTGSGEADQILDIWINYGVCAATTLALQDPSQCAVFAISTAVGMIFDILSIRSLVDKTIEKDNLSIGAEYLLAYYSYGKDEKKMAEGYGLDPNTYDGDELIMKVGSSTVGKWTYHYEDLDYIRGVIDRGIADVERYRVALENPPNKATFIEDFESYPYGDLAEGSSNGIVTWTFVQDAYGNSIDIGQGKSGKGAIPGDTLPEVRNMYGWFEVDTTSELIKNSGVQTFSFWKKIPEFRFIDSGGVHSNVLDWNQLIFYESSDYQGTHGLYVNTCAINETEATVFISDPVINNCDNIETVGLVHADEWFQTFVQIDLDNNRFRLKINNSDYGSWVTVPWQVYRLDRFILHEFSDATYDNIEISYP